MSQKTLCLGFDFGEKRIGIAVGQVITQTASPLGQILNDNTLWGHIETYIKTWKPDVLVVGLPLNMDGTESRQSKKARSFIRLMRKRFNLPTYAIDERLSSKEALSRLEEKTKKLKKEAINAMAAQVILETFLNDEPALSKFIES